MVRQRRKRLPRCAECYTYLVANNFEAKLDVYARREPATPRPVLVYIHGGGWLGGSKEASVFGLFPWLEMGWNVVNVEYRLGRVSQAPAAVEDCLCALRWVAAHAKEYGFDVNRIVVTGGSAGGHLALTTGMIPETAGLDRQWSRGRPSQSRSDRKLVRYHGCERLARRSEPKDVRRGMARRHDEP